MSDIKLKILNKNKYKYCTPKDNSILLSCATSGFNYIEPPKTPSFIYYDEAWSSRSIQQLSDDLNLNQLFSVKESIIPYTINTTQKGISIPPANGLYNINVSNNELTLQKNEIGTSVIESNFTNLSTTLSNDLHVTTLTVNKYFITCNIDFYIDDITLLDPPDTEITASTWFNVLPRIQLLNGNDVIDEYIIQPMQQFQCIRMSNVVTGGNAITIKCLISADTTNRPAITAGNIRLYKVKFTYIELN